MKHWILYLLVPMIWWSPTLFAADRIKAKLKGEVEVLGINAGGVFVGDTDPSSYQRFPITGKVRIAAEKGKVRRVDTSTDWYGPNGLHGRVREKLYVSGKTFTGWTERHIYSPTSIYYSRNVIDGKFEQKIHTDGSGFIEWTVTGAENSIDNSDEGDQVDDNSNVDESNFDETDTEKDNTLNFNTDNSSQSAEDNNDEGGNLPTIDITEEGEFDGVSDRRIEFDSGNHRHPKIKFRDKGFMRVASPKIFRKDGETLVINQKFKLKGRGKGGLGFEPEKKSDKKDNINPSSATSPFLPTPTPTEVNSSFFSNTPTGVNSSPFLDQ